MTIIPREKYGPSIHSHKVAEYLDPVAAKYIRENNSSAALKHLIAELPEEAEALLPDDKEEKAGVVEWTARCLLS